jgi:type IV secretion system protein VirB10
MAKDPFQNLPQIDPNEGNDEQGAHVANDHVTKVDDVTAGAPPRTLLKSATKWAMPLLGLAVVIWLFVPEERAVRRGAPAPVSVDAAQQATDATAFMEKLKEDAAKKPPVVVPVMPGSPPVATAPVNPGPIPATPRESIPTGGRYTPASGQPPLPPGYGGRQATPSPTPMSADETNERAAAAYEKAITRAEEIRSSPIEVGQVKLLSEGTTSSSPPALANLQADLAEAQGAATARAQQQMQERVLAAMAPPKEQAKSKGANEDFLSANASSANGSANLTRQMPPQAGVLVNEGHVIRTVLLTSVSSDLPGRILARVTSDVYDSAQRHVVIPKGSQIIGVYSSQVVVGQERLLMAMNRLILPNGNWISLSGAGASDMRGMSGVKADVNNHFMKMFGSSLVLGASSLLLNRADATVNAVPSPTGTGAPITTGSIFATSFNEVIKTLLERNRQIAPTLSLDAGQEFIFMVAQDMEMLPYRP